MTSENSNSSSNNDRDIEAHADTELGYTPTDSIHNFSWHDVSVMVKDRKTKQQLALLTANSGHVAVGEVLALMGPSGSGKTTLLNVLAHRVAAKGADIQGTLMIDGQKTNKSQLQQYSTYVEQEDALIGSLTVKETIDFAAKLSLSSGWTKTQRLRKVTDLIETFGLQHQADTIIGTPIRKGISGGQKRRVSVASQLVTSPRIMFLDEPTSGLDSTASYEVINYISKLAKKHQIIVIASIHQPSTSTFSLFDKLMLLSQGKTCYFGQMEALIPYFERIGHSIPLHTNPAEYLLDLINTDFSKQAEATDKQLAHIQSSWRSSDEWSALTSQTIGEKSKETKASESGGQSHLYHSGFSAPIILLHRNLIKSYRDLLAYGTRIAMYLCLAILMGTVWLRLPYNQDSIQSLTTAIFFGGAFMSFMAVAYIPSAIEDLQTFKKERANGLYGPFAFCVANFLVGLPWLFLIVILFAVIGYWLANLVPTAGGFWMFVLWLFLDLLAAEGLVMLVTSIAPIFVISLAVTAFANGLWMCVGGFLVPLGTLNVFWKYVFHYIDYQAYVFQGMMVNQFKNTVYNCESVGNSFQCMYPSDLQNRGQIRGTAVLEAFHIAFDEKKIGEWIGILVSIIAAYRILGYLALVLRRS